MTLLSTQKWTLSRVGPPSVEQAARADTIKPIRYHKGQDLPPMMTPGVDVVQTAHHRAEGGVRERQVDPAQLSAEVTLLKERTIIEGEVAV